MDHSGGTWIIDVEGVGSNREVVGVTFDPDDRPELWAYCKDEFVVANRNLSVKGFVIASGSEGSIVSLRDPTLSPRHHKFLEVHFQGAKCTVWIGLEEVVGSSYDMSSFLDDETEDDSDEEDTPSPTVH